MLSTSIQSLLSNRSFVVEFPIIDLTKDPDDLDDVRSTEEDARRYFRDCLSRED